MTRPKTTSHQVSPLWAEVDGQARSWLEWECSTSGQSLPAALRTKHKVPFDFAQGRLSTPQIIAFAMISSGRDDRVGMCEQ
jgi:hypothetical protein